jgi:hypothetical protein
MYPRPILRNEEGASPGGGAPPADSPTAPQGAAPLDVNAIGSLIKGVVAESFGELRNGLFADLRKAGALKQDKPPAPTPAPTPVEAPAASGMTASDVQTLMARERAFARATASVGLSPEQEALVEQTYRAVNPPDPYEWASTFIKVMGLGKPPQAPAAAAPAPAQPTPTVANPTAFDKGPAASSAARDPLAILQNDPRKSTMDDYRRLVAQHGEVKAGEIWRNHVMSFLSTVKVRPDGRR